AVDLEGAVRAHGDLGELVPGGGAGPSAAGPCARGPCTRGPCTRGPCAAAPRGVRPAAAGGERERGRQREEARGPTSERVPTGPAHRALRGDEVGEARLSSGHPTIVGALQLAGGGLSGRFGLTSTKGATMSDVKTSRG